MSMPIPFGALTLTDSVLFLSQPPEFIFCCSGHCVCCCDVAVVDVCCCGVVVLCSPAGVLLCTAWLSCPRSGGRGSRQAQESWSCRTHRVLLPGSVQTTQLFVMTKFYSFCLTSDKLPQTLAINQLF